MEPLPNPEIDLARGVPHPMQSTEGGGNAKRPGDRDRQERCLVVATRSTSSPVKRDRDDEVDRWDVRSCPLPHGSTETCGKIASTRVLEPMDRVRHGTPILVDCLISLGGLKKRGTPSAENGKHICKLCIATGAAARGHELDQALQHFFHRIVIDCRIAVLRPVLVPGEGNRAATNDRRGRPR